jgi:hypothetical protein
MHPPWRECALERHVYAITRTGRFAIHGPNDAEYDFPDAVMGGSLELSNRRPSVAL